MPSSHAVTHRVTRHGSSFRLRLRRPEHISAEVRLTARIVSRCTYRMAYSKAATVRYLKAIGDGGEAAISEGLDALREDQRRSLFNLASLLHSKLKRTNIPRIRRPAGITTAKRFQLVVDQIRKSLTDYEQVVGLDHWVIEFAIVNNYENKTINEIIRIHRQLSSSSASAGRVKLLSCYERGSLYFAVKYNAAAFGPWADRCRNLGVCRATADRQVQLSCR